METLSSGSDGEAYVGSSIPPAADIQPQDCTMALLAAEKVGRAADELKDRIVDQKPGSTEYDCKACPANLIASGFANIQGGLACRAIFAQDAAKIIASR